MTGRGEFIWKPKEFVTEPVGPYVRVLRDHWWKVNEAGEVAIWKSGDGSLHPLANTNPNIAARIGEVPGESGVELLPLAFTPIRLEDYRD